MKGVRVRGYPISSKILTEMEYLKGKEKEKMINVKRKKSQL